MQLQEFLHYFHSQKPAITTEDVDRLFGDKTEYGEAEISVVQQVYSFMNKSKIETVAEAIRVIRARTPESESRMTAQTLINSSIDESVLTPYLDMFSKTLRVVDTIADELTTHTALVIHQRYSQMPTEVVQKLRKLMQDYPPVTSSTDELVKSSLDFFRSKLPSLSAPTSNIRLPKSTK